MSKVSVILPTYNAENTIDRTIESIVAQTYKDWEIICCDDCSTDGTIDKLNEWEKRGINITILKNEKNSRAAFSRNRCIEYSNGIYIAQIDDDDYCDPMRLEKQVDFLERNKEYGFVGSEAYKFDEEGVWGIFNVPEKPNKQSFLSNSPFINPSVMFRKSVLEDIKLYRVSKVTRRTEDYDLFMRLYSNGVKGYNMQEKLVYYYRGKNSFPKCKYEYRIDEAKVRYENFKQLNMLPKAFPFVIKPLIVGLIPQKSIEKIKGIINRG